MASWSPLALLPTLCELSQHDQSTERHTRAGQHMVHQLHDTSCGQSLDPALLDALLVARARARELATPILVRRCLSLPLHPRHYWQALRDADHHVWIWDHAQSGSSFMALDACMQTQPQSIEELKAYHAVLLDRLMDIGTIPPSLYTVPVAFVGQAFDAEHGVSEDWYGWPSRELMVPKLLLAYVAETPTTPDWQGVIQYALIEPHADLEHCAQCMENDYARLLVMAHVDNVRHTACQKTWQSDESQSEFCARVKHAQQMIQRGEASKIVLARSARVSIEKGYRVDLVHSLNHLRTAHPQHICFAIYRPEYGCFMGATPELLVNVEGRNVRSQALAGTTSRGVDENDDQRLADALFNSVKDRREHQWVVETLQRALKHHCAELHISEQPRVVRLPRVQHLDTPIAGVMRDLGGVIDVVHDMHPTPSVAGAPRDVALTWLRQHEMLDRGWYAAPLGWITPAGDGFFAVALRCMLVRSDVAVAFAGAGIVQDSSPQAEWQETELKLRTAMEALCLQT